MYFNNFSITNAPYTLAVIFLVFMTIKTWFLSFFLGTFIDARI